MQANQQLSLMPEAMKENKVIDSEMLSMIRTLCALGEQVARGNIEPLTLNDEQKEFVSSCIEERETKRSREEQKKRFESQLLSFAQKLGVEI